MARYPLRPRYRGLAWGALALGGGLVALGPFTAPLVLASGAAGLLLGGGYLASPTWRLAIVTDERGLRIEGRRGVRLELPWLEVQKVIASPSTKTCFIDGGAAERRLMVPGDGAPAPYWIAERARLYDEVLAAVDPAKVEEVALVSDRMT